MHLASGEYSKMQITKLYWMIFLWFAFATVLPSVKANIADFDEVWQKRATEAWNRTLESYEPHPEKIVSHLNLHTHR